MASFGGFYFIAPLQQNLNQPPALLRNSYMAPLRATLLNQAAQHFKQFAPIVGDSTRFQLYAQQPLPQMKHAALVLRQSLVGDNMVS